MTPSHKTTHEVPSDMKHILTTARNRRNGKRVVTEEEKAKRKATREANKSEFQKDLAQFGDDTLVKALSKVRRQMFNNGESARGIETMLKARFKVLRKKLLESKSQ